MNKFRFRIVVIANPYGRKKVEAGKLCQRGNGRNVDLNRNWDFYWGKNIQQKEEYPGKYPFSEKETKFLKKSVKYFRPHVFLSVHSGIHGLYTPYAFFKKGINKKAQSHLYPIQKKYCPFCRVGPASVLLKYRSSGTSLDYMYKKMKVRYSYTWEIYDNTKDEVKKLAIYLRKHSKGKTPIKRYSHSKVYSFLETKSSTNFKNFTLAKRCFSMFNPLNRRKLNSVTRNWVRAMKSFFKSFI